MNAAKILKPHLRFEVGDLVFFKSDPERTFPLVILSVFSMEDDFDYIIARPPAKKNREAETFYISDKCLIPEIKPGIE